MEVADKKVCLVTSGSNPNVFKSCRNLQRVSVLPDSAMNVYQMVNADVLLFTEGALEHIKEVYGS